MDCYSNSVAIVFMAPINFYGIKISVRPKEMLELKYRNIN